jgi:hypothetical protein
MEEQRIKNLEEELKVLKNQIKAVLLDIKEQLATGGNGQSSAPPWAGAGQPSAPPWAGGHHVEGGTNISVGLSGGGEQVSAAPREGAREVAASAAPKPGSIDGETGEEAEVSFDSILSRTALDKTAKASAPMEGANGEKQVDLLTISVLAQWLTRASETVSKEQIGKLIEIYDITGNLPPRLKQAILLLADLYGNGNKDVEDDEDIPASVSLQLLIELDSLLRYRTGALESVVLSMLLDKGQSNRKGG